ncbi:STAS domain-containing protein [Streptomyces kanamyceticus]|uniref:Anti-sigma factor antagonist n=1 Tax=Streptomyces kanamyceticus TaxID=1967 RepID=A0A5J6GEG8_STRKN|nr:STAS domain-containing protein [Streptomyces kanamyceticus]QEU93317.1 anti-sigma factor antagonist [Streptomyces kanamyceticus]
MSHGVPPHAGHLYIHRVQGRTVMEFHGDIDIVAALTIMPRLDAVTAPMETLLVIDLTPTTFFDCSGLALLCRADRRLRERSGALLLVCPQALTLRMLHVLGLTERFHPAPTLTDTLRERLPARE